MQSAAESTWHAAAAARRAAAAPAAAVALPGAATHSTSSSSVTTTATGAGTGLAIGVPAQAAAELDAAATAAAAETAESLAAAAAVIPIPISPRAERAAASAKSPVHAPPAIKPVVLTFTGISYYVNTKAGEKQLLQNVSGFARPGTVTALCGASGAGKTTLLDGECLEPHPIAQQADIASPSSRWPALPFALYNLCSSHPAAAVLAFRKTTGRTEGSIRLNGIDATHTMSELHVHVDRCS